MVEGDRSEAGGALPLDLLERGDPAFVDALRGLDDAEALAAFAGPWFEDRRPGPRKLILEYLDRPLNAYRHEKLIKLLFKQAEAAGNDPLMARFLVLFDRSIRRKTRTRTHYENRVVASSEEGQALRDAWVKLGYTSIHAYRAHDGRHRVHGNRTETVIVMPRGTAMPRGRMVRDAWGNRLELAFGPGEQDQGQLTIAPRLQRPQKHIERTGAVADVGQRQIDLNLVEEAVDVGDGVEVGAGGAMLIEQGQERGAFAVLLGME